MAMPYLSEDGPGTKTKISPRVGDLNIEGRSKSLGKPIQVCSVKIPNPQGTPTVARLNLLHLLDFNIHYQVIL